MMDARLPPEEKLFEKAEQDSDIDLDFAMALYHEWKSHTCPRTSESPKAQIGGQTVFSLCRFSVPIREAQRRRGCSTDARQATTTHWGSNHCTVIFKKPQEEPTSQISPFKIIQAYLRAYAIPVIPRGSDLNPSFSYSPTTSRSA